MGRQTKGRPNHGWEPLSTTADQFLQPTALQQSSHHLLLLLHVARCHCVTSWPPPLRRPYRPTPAVPAQVATGIQQNAVSTEDAMLQGYRAVAHRTRTCHRTNPTSIPWRGLSSTLPQSFLILSSTYFLKRGPFPRRQSGCATAGSSPRSSSLPEPYNRWTSCALVAMQEPCSRV